MKYFGIEVAEGTSVGNLTVASGTSFPLIPSTGELFYRTDLTELYLYKDAWGVVGGGGAGAVSSVNTQTGDVVLTKTDIGLSNVDNTSDASKPVSTATQTALNLKANIASPTFTGTVSGITSTMVGLGSVDNTSDASKPVSTDQQTALNLKANIASPVFTGNVTGLGVSTGTSFNAITGLASVAPLAAGSAAVGISTLASRQDHVHPLQTTVSGNAGTATALATARSLTIGSTGKTFDGSAAVSWSLAEIGAAATSHVHTATDITSGTVATARLGSGTADSTTFLSGDQTWKTVTGGATLSDDTTTNASYYPTFATATSGAMTTAKVASTKLYFNPSTGTLNATIFNALSDERTKTNVETIVDAADTMSQLRGVEFDWIDGGAKSSGVIAQELEAILPHLVSTSPEGMKSVNYSGLIGYLIEAVKELTERVEYLEGSE